MLGLRSRKGFTRVAVSEAYSVGAFLVAQSVKNLPAVQETWVRSLGREDSLEKEMATYSSILAWKTSWTEEPGGLQSMGSQRVGLPEWLTLPHFRPTLGLLQWLLLLRSTGSRGPGFSSWGSQVLDHSLNS